jgi:hypothetical protein
MYCTLISLPTVLSSRNEPMRCNENTIYVFLFWELRGLSPNIHIHVSVIYECTVGTGRQNIIILFWK